MTSSGSRNNLVSSTDPEWVRAAADALCRARRDAVALSQDDPLWSGGLTLVDAALVARRLYTRELGPEPPTAWKLGALDVATQIKFGLDQPLVAPVLTDRLQCDATTVSLRREDFIAPKIEVEVGIQVGPHGMRAVPCMELIDTRLSQWLLPPAIALADFGLQGAMVFGRPGTPPEHVTVRLWHDGDLIATATQSWHDSTARLGLLSGHQSDALYTVATGSITPLVTAVRGVWEADFDGLGALKVIIS